MGELNYSTVIAASCNLESRPAISHQWEEDIEDSYKKLHKQQLKINKMSKYIKRKAWASKRTVSKGHRYE